MNNNSLTLILTAHTQTLIMFVFLSYYYLLFYYFYFDYYYNTSVFVANKRIYVHYSTKLSERGSLLEPYRRKMSDKVLSYYGLHRLDVL